MNAKPPKNATDIDAAVGRNLRIRRMAKGFSQSQLARGLGVTFQQVQKYEKGTNRIGSGRLLRIAQILEIPVSALFDGIEGGPFADQVPRSGLLADRRALRLAQAFDAIDDPVLRLSIIELVEMTAAIPPEPVRRRRRRRRRRKARRR